jgi:hypothetical protein
MPIDTRPKNLKLEGAPIKDMARSGSQRYAT